MSLVSAAPKETEKPKPHLGVRSLYHKGDVVYGGRFLGASFSGNPPVCSEQTNKRYIGADWCSLSGLELGPKVLSERSLHQLLRAWRSMAYH